MKIKKQILKEKVEEVQDVMEQALEQSEISKKNFEEVTKKPSAIDVTLEREPKWMSKLPKGLVESYGTQLKENNYVFNVKSRKELADLISQLKESKLEYKINRSLKEDYRYDIIINEAVEDEYGIYNVEVSMPVYITSKVCATDEYEAQELVEQWLEAIEYANETVGFESDNDKVQVETVSAWDSKSQMEHLSTELDHIADKDDLIEFGYDEDFDESLKEEINSATNKFEETDGYKIFKDKQDCFNIESPSGRQYELFELVGLGNSKITSDIIAYFEVTDKGYKTLVGYNFGKDPKDAISYIKDYEEKGIRNLETNLLDEALKESKSSKTKLIKLFKQFADTYDEIEYELQQLDPDYVAELFSGERLDSMNEVFQEVSFDELPIRAFSDKMVDFLEGTIEESCCKEEVKGIKHNPKEEKHFEEKCETYKECNEELAKTNKQLQESVKIIEDIWEYEPWSGAIETWEKIEKADKIEDLDFLLEDIYPEGLTKTELNDLLWFEADWVLEQLGLDEEVDDTVEDEEEVEEVDYDRRAVEKEYELEDGELDGMTIREAETYLDLEDGELDRFVIEEKEEVKESLKESKEKLEAGKNNKGWIFVKALEDEIKAIPELKDFKGEDYPTASKEVFEGKEAEEYFDGFDPKDSNWFVIEPTDKLYKEIEKVFKLKAKIKESLTKVKTTEFNEDLSDEELNKFLGNPQKITEKLASEEPEEHFTEEEQMEYDIDEFGNSLNNYDEYVHCQWCGEPVSKFEAKHELNMGWLCPDCVAALASRGEKGVFDESKKLTEAPDEFGLPTDDELAAEEEQAKKDLEAKLAAKRQQRDAARQKELDAKAAKEATIKKGEDLYNEFSKIYNESDNVDDAIEGAFNLLVPRSGAAETVAGEMVRAMMRILYRDYNDGDKFYEGYGLETCGGSAQYLSNQSEKLAKAFEDVVKEAQGYYDFDSKYTEAITDIADELLRILSMQPELFGEVNTDDSRAKYEWEGETVSYDCEESLPDDLIKCLEKEWISESDIEQWVEDDIRMYYDTTDELSVEVRSDWVYVDGLGSKSACEDLGSGGQLYKWMESYAKDCIEENQSELYTASDFADWYDHSKEYDKLDKVNDIFSNYYGDDWYDMDDVESAYEEADEDIKQDISDIINESLKNKSVKSLTEGASKYQEFETLWNKLSKATDENNIDDSNKTVIEIEKLLPFKDEEEHKHWLDISSTFKFWEDFEDLTKSIAKRLKNIKEAKVDLTKVNGTYSQLLMDKIKDWNERFENEELGSIQEFKQEILNQIATANDTPAKRNFIANLNKQSSVLNALMYINNAVLKAMGAGVENSSLIKPETNLSLKESFSVLLNTNDNVAKGYIAVDDSSWYSRPRRIYTPTDIESDFLIADILLPRENVVTYCAKHFEVDVDKVKAEFAYSLDDTDTDVYKVEISF